MLFRTDLTQEETSHAQLLHSLCEAAARDDLVLRLRHWDEAALTVLTRRVAVVRPADHLDDYTCLYYGDEIQERFHVDFTGKKFRDIDEFEDIRGSLDAFRLVVEHKVPHFCRVSRPHRTPEAVDYARIIFPVIRRGQAELVVSIFDFIN